MRTIRLLTLILFAFSIQCITKAQHLNLDFAKGIHGNFYYDINGFERDTLGHIYMAGAFRKTTDFSPGTDTTWITSTNNSDDMYLLKLDSLGNLVWVNTLGGNYNDYIKSISLDKDGNIYTFGYYYGQVDFDPDTTTAIKGVDHNDQSFIAKYTSDGDFVWVKNIGRTADYNGSMTVDKNGRIFIADKMRFTTGFVTDIDSFYTGLHAVPHVYLLELDSTGNFNDVKWFNIDVTHPSLNLTLDHLNNIYLTGVFDDITDFDPSSAIVNMQATGSSTDGFILKLDSNGDFLWVKTTEGTGNGTFVEDLEVDTFGNIYTTGFFYGTNDFDPGPNVYNLSDFYGPGYPGDIFIQKLNTQGEFIWAKSMGNNKIDVGYDLSLNANNDVYITGQFEGTVDFDPGTGVHNLSTGVYGTDAFLLKLSTDGQFEWVHAFQQNLTNTRGFFVDIDNHNNIYTNGDYRISVDFDPGPGNYEIPIPYNDHAQYIVRLKECYSKTIDTIVSCDSITWIDGNTYNTSNYTAKHTLSNINGCDSIVHLNFTLQPTHTYVDVINTCSKVVWIDGNIYTESNHTASHMLTTIHGCDSLITLDLTIGVEDISTTVVDSTITANLSGATYQWLNCQDNYSIINGETSAVFSPNANGSYCVQITQNGCVDTSLCESISIIGIPENNPLKDVKFYPNPVANTIYFDLGNLQHTDLKLINEIGQVLLEKKDYSAGTHVLDLNIPSGIYIIELKHDAYLHRIKFIKQ